MTDYMTGVIAHALTHTKEETVKAFDITYETLSRYMRKAREEAREMHPEMIAKEPIAEEELPANILIIDIETAPILGYVWGLWKQNVYPSQIVKDWFILGWSAKWFGEDKIYTEFVSSKEAIAGDDSLIMFPLWDLLEQADIVIAHNASKFDVPKVLTRMFLAGLNPPSPFQVLDTLYSYRKQFSFSSNKLDYINKQLNIKQKVETGGFELWEKCCKGDKEALKQMEDYNINDVVILEENYIKVRPWIKNHPNINVYGDKAGKNCTNCGSSDIVEIKSRYGTPVNAYITYRCNNCGAIAGRERKAVKSAKENKDTIRSIAR